MLEPLVPAHAPHLFPYLNDDRLYRYHTGLPSSVEELERRFTSWAARKSPDGSQTWLNYALRRDDRTYVGWVQATIVDKVATIGYDIFVPFWRQGFAKEACGELIRALFDEHAVTRIDAVVDAENAASIGLLENLGFTLAWTGPSEDMPGRIDRRYELSAQRFVQEPRRRQKHS
jgi:ribosomal-protein-alanine N-acetyltransferase